MGLNLRYFPRIGTSELMLPALLNFVQLLDAGKTLPTASIRDGQEAFAAFDEDTKQLAGAIIFSREKELGTAWIHFAFTEEQWRRRGVYTWLMKLVFEKLKAQGIREINQYVHVTNEPMQCATTDIGWEPVYTRMRKML